MTAVTRYLRAGVHSKQEISAYLQRRGIQTTVAQRVMAEARANGLINDDACAKLWAEHWARRGYAWSAIRLKLTAKGLSDEVIARAAKTLHMASADLLRARELVNHHLQRTTTRNASPRVWRLLTSRGFDQDVIEQVLTEDPE